MKTVKLRNLTENDLAPLLDGLFSSGHLQVEHLYAEYDRLVAFHNFWDVIIEVDGYGQIHLSDGRGLSSYVYRVFNGAKTRICRPPVVLQSAGTARRLVKNERINLIDCAYKIDNGWAIAETHEDFEYYFPAGGVFAGSVYDVFGLDR